MARKRASIEFAESGIPIQEAVTKFGGQPFWLEQPEWPLSRATGDPMRFICQIALPSDLFGKVCAQMAYVFMTDEEDEYIDGTWEPEGGENAVILQPGSNSLPTKQIELGPTLYRMVKRPGQAKLVQEPCEYLAKLNYSEDPDFLPETELWELPEEKSDEYHQMVAGNKLGGTPDFIQSDQIPDLGTGWHLLLQLDSEQVPFYVNFGDAGTGYAFISASGEEARFLWQCY